MLGVGIALIIIGVVCEIAGIRQLWRSSRMEIEAQADYETRDQVVELGAVVASVTALSPTISGGEPPTVEKQLADLRRLLADHLDTWKGETRKLIGEQVRDVSERLQRHHGRDVTHIERVLRARRPSLWPLRLFAGGLLIQTAGGVLLAL